MKRVLAVVLSCIMLISAMPMAFAEGQPQIIVSSATAKAGEPVVTIELSVKNNPGFTAMRVFVDYDPNVLTLTNSESTDLLAGMSPSFSPTYEERPYQMQWSSGTKNATGNGVFATLTFTVNGDAEEGEYPIVISYAEDDIFNTSFDNVFFEVANGMVEVSNVVEPNPISDFTYELSDGGIVITGYNGSRNDVIIADRYEIDGTEYNVVGIAESAFEEKDTLTSVEIPATVKSIEDYAFYNCTSLTSITVLGTDTEIGEEALGYYYISRKLDGIVEGVIIYGYTGSTSEAYADENEIIFVSLSEEHTHDFSVLQSDDTYHWYKCANCDEETEKSAHSGGTATCTEKAKCTVCGKEYGETLNHTNAYDVFGKAATCKETGLTDGRYCPDCETWLVEQEVISVDLTNHAGYGTETRDYVAATCEADGYTGDTYCLGCGNKIGNGAVIGKLGHDFGVWTDNEDGKHIHSCQREGCSVTETADHVWNDGEETKAATCKEQGETTFTCTVCGTTKTEPIPATGEHSDEDNNGCCDTCEEMMQGGQHCKFCGKIHGGLFGWLVKFFHSIFAIFKR